MPNEFDEPETCGETCDELAFLSKKILELNKQLIESEKAKSRFLSLVASELNNPMAALLGLIPHLPPLEEENEKTALCQTIHAEALKLDFRIQNLVAAASIESGDLTLSLASTDVKIVAREAVELLRYALEAKNVAVSINDGIRRPVVTDPMKLSLILVNLISNGCAYGNEEGMITIDLRAEESRLIIDVTNEGEGPGVEFKPQVFTRFAEGPGGLHGLGLGLSIVRHYCELMGGGIDYDVHDGKVTFTVTLALDAAEADTTACGANEFLFETFDEVFEL